MRRFLKYVLYAVLAVLGLCLLALGGLVVFDRPHTPPIHDADGRPVSTSIASLEQVDLGGLPQYVLLRGHDRTDPVLLFLHGGPGMPAMYLAHHFQRDLERDFVVVHWDQRGAGKSYSDEVPAASITVEQLLSDTHELVQMLRARFNQEKIYLVGHSFGSYLGTLYAARHPDVLHAYVGMGQVVNAQKSRAIQERFLRTQAETTGNTEALAELDTHGRAVYEKWLFAFGAELHGATNWLPLLKIGLRAPEYGFFDFFKIAPGSSFSSRHMEYDAIDGPLDKHVTRLNVPVYFFQGRYDYTTPSELVAAYADSLAAPSVEVVWFEQSAHFPFLEEPGRFTDAMRRVRAETAP